MEHAVCLAGFKGEDGSCENGEMNSVCRPQEGREAQEERRGGVSLSLSLSQCKAVARDNTGPRRDQQCPVHSSSFGVREKAKLSCNTDKMMLC